MGRGMRSWAFLSCAFVVLLARQALAEGSEGDNTKDAGYLPGYRNNYTPGVSPFVPRVGGLPGAMTPSFGAPVPHDDWSFAFSGFMSEAARWSYRDRINPASPGQHSIAVHSGNVLPVIESYASFVGTSSVPGSWVGLMFEYGNKYVTTHLSLDTFNPSRPTNYVTPGSQLFVDVAYITFRAPPIDRLRLVLNVGARPIDYGNLAQYGAGQWPPAIISGPRGMGETVDVEYDLSDTYTLQLGHGVEGSLGKAPDGLVAGAANNYANPNFPSSWVQHGYAALLRKGDIQLRTGLYALHNWSADDRGIEPVDNPGTPQFDESKRADGHITVLGWDARMLGGPYGYASAAVSYVDGWNAYPLTLLNTFGGNGQSLTDKWWGAATGGTGSLLVLGAEYTLSIGTVLRSPQPFNGEGADLIATLSAQYAKTHSTDPTFDGRSRNKESLEMTYRMLPWLSFSTRFDRVAPNSKDSLETFYVVAPKLIFKTGWNTHEALTVNYVKWFLGKDSHTEPQGPIPANQLDDQMLGVVFTLWW